DLGAVLLDAGDVLLEDLLGLLVVAIRTQEPLPGDVSFLIVGHENVGQETIAKDVLGDVLVVALLTHGRQEGEIGCRRDLGSGTGGSGLNRRGFRRGFGGRNWSRRQGQLGCRDRAWRRRGAASRLLPGGDASGQLQRKGSELGVVLRRDDLGVILAGVEEGAARGSVAHVAYRDELGLVGLLRSVLAQGLERV